MTASSGRVLIVEDHVDIAKSTAMLLEAWGYTSRIVSDAQGAFRELQEWRPDLVLLDMGLPKTSGFDIAKQIRQSTDHRGMPIIICVSGHGYEEHRKKGMESGCNEYMVKPVDNGQLQKMLLSYMAKGNMN